MWLYICQGLVLAGFVIRFLGGVIYATMGREKQEPTGFLGIFFTIVFAFFGGLILWRAGAVSTIMAPP